MDDTAVDRDAEIDMLVAMSGATRLQASRALDENQGNINSALTQLSGTKQSRKKNQAHSHVSSTAKSARPSSRPRQYDDNTDDAMSKLPPTRKNTPPSEAIYECLPDTVLEQRENQRNMKARDSRELHVQEVTDCVERDSSDKGGGNSGAGNRRSFIFMAAILLVLVAVISTSLAVTFSFRTRNENDPKANDSIVGGAGATPSPTTVPATAPPVASSTTSLPPATMPPMPVPTESKSTFRVTWGLEHTGSCALAAVPRATAMCANEAEIMIIDETEFSNCAVTGASEIKCVGNLGNMFYSAEFSCSSIDGRPEGGVASLDEASEDCLGGTPTEGTWIHGIQLFLLCDGEPQPIGTCDPIEATGSSNACSLGFTCSDGLCEAETLTIPEITSTIGEAICV